MVNKINYNEIKKFLITKNVSIKDAMRQMDKNREKIICVVDSKNRLMGSVTDGDIRRWILANGKLEDKVSKIYNKNPKFTREKYDLKEIKKIMLRTKIEWIPVVNKNNQVIKILIWDNVFKDEKIKYKRNLNIPVVIMAGGSGTRLDPFTKILPKPLIPINGKPIIEIIMERFNQYGIKDFFITLNYKSQIMRAYFKEVNSEYDISYINEHTPLGTAGSLRMLINKVKGPILVTNCDILIKSDYNDFIEFHNKNNNDITIMSSLKHFIIPYGVCEISNGGTLNSIKEKPIYDFLINTGMYILNSKVLKLIPKKEVFHMTNLIKRVQINKGKIGIFPISENSWIDIGQWKEYHNALRRFKNV